MSRITNKNDGNPDLADESTGTQHGVPAGAAEEESHAGYGGTDRLQSEAGPLQPDPGPNAAPNAAPDATKDQGKDI